MFGLQACFASAYHVVESHKGTIFFLKKQGIKVMDDVKKTMKIEMKEERWITEVGEKSKMWCY